MDRLFETAYPRLKTDPTPQELQDVFTPTAKELKLAEQHAGRTHLHRLALLMHLKLFQRLGYFMRLKDAPAPIKLYIAQAASIARIPNQRQLADYDRSGTQRRHLKLVREYVQVRTMDDRARDWLEGVARRAAETKNAEADLINVVLEELVKERYELPGFTVLQRMVRRARDNVNSAYYRSITTSLTHESRALIDELFVTPEGAVQSPWQALKREPRKPTNKEIRRHLQHIRRLRELIEKMPAVVIPLAKLRYFRQVARSLDAGQMSKLAAARRYALAVIYIRAQFSKTLDDAGKLYIRMVNGIEKTAQQHLQDYKLQHEQRTDSLIAKLKTILVTYHESSDSDDPLIALKDSLPEDIEVTITECEEHLSYAGNNYLPFMLKPYQPLRAILLNCLEIIDPRSTSSDKQTEKLIAALMALRNSRLDRVEPDTIGLRGDRDFGWLTDKWRKLVLIRSLGQVTHLHRKYFELATLQYIKQELNSADLYIQDSAQYDDFREQLVDQETYEQELPLYGEVAGIATEPKAFCQQLKEWLVETSKQIDASFPENSHASIVDGRLRLSKADKTPVPADLQSLDDAITQRLPLTNIVDVLTDTEMWLDLHRLFGPLSGNQGRLDDPKMRFITTLFCYGCNLGPAQTARAVKGLNRKQVAWLNLKNITEDRLDKAIVKVINAYNQFELPKYWGAGNRASVDGTKWNLYEQNLLSEYHIRYGGYGGIGYYLVSDKYIALFSHFIPCGVYEANYLLDGLMENESDIQPDTVHGDTQAQNFPVFGLSHLLGIQLMPRIRGINKLKLYRPDRKVSYKNINALFSESINWPLIETHLPDMLQVVISIKKGMISPSTILRRMGTASRKNKLYFALRELGKVIRTVFLLRYINDVELRKTINAATNKSEEFNGFTKWIFFGGNGVIAENLEHEQRKIVKYNQLVANLVILHNVVNMTQVLKDLQNDGIIISPELLDGLNPFRNGHINRFGDYVVNLDREVAPLDYKIRFF